MHPDGLLKRHRLRKDPLLESWLRRLNSHLNLNPSVKSAVRSFNFNSQNLAQITRTVTSHSHCNAISCSQPSLFFLIITNNNYNGGIMVHTAGMNETRQIANYSVNCVNYARKTNSPLFLHCVPCCIQFTHLNWNVSWDWDLRRLFIEWANESNIPAALFFSRLPVISLGIGTFDIHINIASKQW